MNKCSQTFKVSEVLIDGYQEWFEVLGLCLWQVEYVDHLFVFVGDDPFDLV